MGRVRLFHWKLEEATLVVDLLAGGGWDVDYDPAFSPQLMRAMRQCPPDAVVIDLSRLPSHGREVATVLRGNRHTCLIPILFLDGAPEKVAIVREKLPDATYCERPRLLASLRKCIKNRPENPVVPTQMMDRYAARTAAQKMGITAGCRVAVVDGPRDYARVIGALPEGVEYDEESCTGCAVAIWFVEAPEAFMAALPRMRKAAAMSKLWVAWRKKSVHKDSPLNENLIRDMAIESGLVDYKVCAINETWSGLCLAVKKAGRA